jgi:hypothetical protein
MLWGGRIKSLADERHFGLDGDAGRLSLEVLACVAARLPSPRRWPAAVGCTTSAGACRKPLSAFIVSVSSIRENGSGGMSHEHDAGRNVARART